MTGAEFFAAYLPELAAGLTGSVLAALPRGLRKTLQKPERDEALQRCSVAAVAALVAAADTSEAEEQKLLLGIFRDFFSAGELAPEVGREVAELLRGQRLPRQTFAELFEEAGYDADTLPGLDLRQALASFESAFLLTAIQEPALQGEIQLHQIATQTHLQRQILERMGALVQALLLRDGDRGSSRVAGGIHGYQIRATNVVSGIQIIIGGGAGGDPGGSLAAGAREDTLRRRYLQGLRSYCRSLPVAALGGEESLSDEVTLDQVFIELDSTTQIPLTERELEALREERGAMPEGREPTRPLSLAEGAREHSRLVILGDPGSGKSSFAREVLARIADSHLEGKPAPWEISAETLPALIELRDLAPRLSQLNLDGLAGPRRNDLLVGAVRGLLADELERFDASGFEGSLTTALAAGSCFLVLDGLDEVAPDHRRVVRLAVAATLQKYKLRRVLITCRTLSYQGTSRFHDFQDLTIAPLTREQIRTFIAAWYRAQDRLGRVRKGEREAKTQDLQQAASSSDLESLSRNPMLLTTMALIHQKEVGLPKERVRLYHLAVEVLALRWQKYKTGRTSPSDALAERLKDNLGLWQILERLGHETHQAQQLAGERRSDSPGSLLRTEAMAILEQASYLGSASLADEFLDYIDQRAGLLIGQGSGEGKPPAYRFPHQTLQEYLAGRFMASSGQRLKLYREKAAKGDFWAVASQLGAEDLLHVRQLPDELLDLAFRLCPVGRWKRSLASARATLWSAYCAAIVDRETVETSWAPDRGKPYLRRLRKRLASVAKGNLPSRERVEAGRLLGTLGEPDDALTDVDRLELCRVPPGRFWFSGLAEERDEDLRRGGWMEIPYGYWIGRFPVTQGQFGAFVEEKGYLDPELWPEASKEGFWKEGEGFEGRYDAKARTGPIKFREPFDLPNHPVAGITWYEALAFCRWLSRRARGKGWIPAGWSFCLPSEAEWEQGARGGERVPRLPVLRCLGGGFGIRKEEDGEEEEEGKAPGTVPNPEERRPYPWGAEDPEGRGNFGGAADSTSRPGTFPAGASPVGCEDLAGNVWEWSRSLYGKGRSRREEKERLKEAICAELEAAPDEGRWLLGGSYYSDSSSAGCAARDWVSPGGWYDLIGFRVVLLPLTLDSENSEYLEL